MHCNTYVNSSSVRHGCDLTLKPVTDSPLLLDSLCINGFLKNPNLEYVGVSFVLSDRPFPFCFSDLLG